MQRVIIVYNERSSKAGDVERGVIQPIRKKKGVLVGKYGIRETTLVDNAEKIARILSDGDVVVAAGGDGTATMAMNGVIRSGKKVSMMVLPYGNFNDMARAWRGKEGRTWYPIEVRINGEHFWYAGGYFSMGMFAQSTNEFNGKRRRKELQDRRGGLIYSIGLLAKWYFRHKSEKFLPEGKIDGEKWEEKTTDFLAVNTERVARVMRTSGYGLDKQTFYCSRGGLGSFLRLSKYMLKSMSVGMPGEEVRERVVEFGRPTKVAIQTDGEYWMVDKVKKVEVRKTDFGIKIAKRV